ncbi:hypothetical protein LAZ67_13000380, partial [Cordylochernes scorpioides]
MEGADRSDYVSLGESCLESGGRMSAIAGSSCQNWAGIICRLDGWCTDGGLHSATGLLAGLLLPTKESKQLLDIGLRGGVHHLQPGASTNLFSYLQATISDPSYHVGHSRTGLETSLLTHQEFPVLGPSEHLLTRMIETYSQRNASTKFKMAEAISNFLLYDKEMPFLKFMHLIPVQYHTFTIFSHCIVSKISLSPSDTNLRFILERRQLTLTLAFAMTINKAQGQTFARKDLLLQEPVFTHGYFYVAFYQVQILDSIRVNLTPTGMPPHHLNCRLVLLLFLRNLNPRQGLCNDTRMVIQRMCSHVFEEQILTETKVVHAVLVPKISGKNGEVSNNYNSVFLLIPSTRGHDNHESDIEEDHLGEHFSGSDTGIYSDIEILWNK